MKTLSNTGLVPTALVAATVIAIGACDARAWSFGSSASRGGWGSYGSYGSYGRYANYRRYVSYGSSGSYGSYGSYRSYGSCGSYRAVSYGSYGSNGSNGRTFYSPYLPPNDYAPEPPLPPQPDDDSLSQATIHLNLPTDAQVFVNDRSTESTGPDRRYVSRGLRDDQTYVYRLRVEFQELGERIVENKRVRVKAGDAIDLNFGPTEQIAEAGAAATELTLHVPKNAEVKLNGAPTAQTGEPRTFTTSALPVSQTWDNYVVRVQVEQDGQSLVEEQSLTLVGGQRHALTFDFADEPTTLAARD